ncbi:MAG: hypothetical protein J3K34DRAFT_460669 [Monoraphidium minutum]|nr:MAG: hypothetical protein J3K34DRAFT_460669 [Monoraphidium minutum]
MAPAFAPPPRRHEPCMDPSVSHAPDREGRFSLPGARTRARAGGAPAGTPRVGRLWLHARVVALQPHGPAPADNAPAGDADNAPAAAAAAAGTRAKLPPPPPGGAASGRLLVVWGAFATAKHFDDVAARLRDDQRLEVLCYHHRGVASSGPCSLDTPQSSALLAGDALALVDHVWGRTAAVHVYGASMGGMVAQELAVRLAPAGRLASLAISVSSRGLGAHTPRAAAPLITALLHSRPAAWALRQWYGAHRSPAALVRRLMRGVFAPDFLSLKHPASGVAMRDHYARWWLERFEELFTFHDANTIACHMAVIVTHWLDDGKAALLRECGAPILVQAPKFSLFCNRGEGHSRRSQPSLTTATRAVYGRPMAYRRKHSMMMACLLVAALLAGAPAAQAGASLQLDATAPQAGTRRYLSAASAAARAALAPLRRLRAAAAAPPAAAAAKPAAPAKPAAGGAAAAAVAGERCYDLAWTTLGRSGKKYGNGTFGALKAEDGRDIFHLVPDASPLPPSPLARFALADPSLRSQKGLKLKGGVKPTVAYSLGPDFPSMHTPAGGNTTYILNHFESGLPSTMYISKLAPSDAKGNLKIVDTRAVDASKVGGFWYTCSGSLTPWGTHLASEEFITDCIIYENALLPCKAGRQAAIDVCGIRESYDDELLGYSLDFVRYYGLYGNTSNYGLPSIDFLNNQTAMDLLHKKFNCYNYGGTPEVTVLPGGKTKIVKWRTLGRISHELSYVMPDNRTVYTTDDSSNGVLLKFVADRPADLSSGSLYAAKLKGQRLDGGGKPTWDVTWIKLGTSTQAALEKLIARRIRFSEIFLTANPVLPPGGGPPKCPPGFSATNSANPGLAFVDKTKALEYQLQCIKLKPGMETAAAFLEPRRYATLKGATVEFEKSEGFTASPSRRQAFMGVAKIGKGMTDDPEYNTAGANDINLAPNSCGGVMQFDLGADWSITRATMLLQGDAKSGTGEGYTCNKDNIAGPDNVHAVANILFICEDSGAHANNFLWAYDLDSGSLTRVLSAPATGEVSGISVSRPPNGRAYLTMTVQHPGTGTSGEPATAAEVEEQRGYVGYIGPLPADIMNGAYDLRFEGVPVPTGTATARPVATPRVCARPVAKRKPCPLIRSRQLVWRSFLPVFFCSRWAAGGPPPQQRPRSARALATAGGGAHAGGCGRF